MFKLRFELSVFLQLLNSRHDNEEFIKLVQGCVEKTLPSTKEAGFEVAKERSIDKIGQELKAVYESVLDK